jgi:phage terminase large subunit
MKLNPALKDFWRTKCDTRVLKGGRASSKTWDAAGVAIYLAANYPLKFLCMRQFQNKIQESVYAILVIQIDLMGYRHEFDIQKTTIIHKVTGSSFHFYGIHRNINEIKGFEGADIGWIEEAEGLTKEQWSIIEPTLRKEGAQSWILFNPKFVNDFVMTNFKHDPDNGVIVRHINYPENPFLSETMKRKIQRLKDSDHEEYEHIYLGVPLSDDSRVVIKISWIMAAIDAHVKLGIDPQGLARIGYDIADDGGDMNATVTAKGMLAFNSDEWKGAEDEILKSCARAYQEALKHKALITYDSIGVGASAGGKFGEINADRKVIESEWVSYERFNAAAGVNNPDLEYGDTGIINKDFFSNLKAQAWWMIADRFKNTYNAVTKGEEFTQDQLISISSDMPNLQKLTQELSTPRRDYDSSGRVKVESKKDLAKRDVASPNIADAFVMAFSPREAVMNVGVVRSSRSRR